MLDISYLTNSCGMLSGAELYSVSHYEPSVFSHHYFLNFHYLLIGECKPHDYFPCKTFQWRMMFAADQRL